MGLNWKNTQLEDLWHIKFQRIYIKGDFGSLFYILGIELALPSK